MIGIARRIPVNMDVCRLYTISCSVEGFFLERHPEIAAVDTFTE